MGDVSDDDIKNLIKHFSENTYEVASNDVMVIKINSQFKFLFCI